MAATVSSAWAKPGAWALDSEQNEDELNTQIMAQQQKPEPPTADFPSLTAAATAKPKKKNKAQPLSLAQFNSYSSAPKPTTTTTTNEPKGLTQDELLMLPTGPRERTAEELERPRLGGGFRNYGGDRDRVRFSENRRERDGNYNLGPSRADEVDDWSKTKKLTSFGSGPGDRAERRDKGGFFNSSRADGVDNWAANKAFVDGGPRRERRMGFDSYSNGSGPDSENWLKKKEERGSVSSNGNGVEGDTWGRRESNGSGRPKLNLQPRTLAVAKSETATEGKGKGANPFGEARPREEVLKEKGKDWKEIDEKLEAVKIKEVSIGERSEGFGRRRGFGLGRSDAGDEKSWRKSESGDALRVPSPMESRFNSSSFSICHCNCINFSSFVN